MHKKRIISTIILSLCCILITGYCFSFGISAKNTNTVNYSSLKCSMIITNTWNENNKVYSQISGTLTNAGNNKIKNWKLNCKLSQTFTVSQYWNGTYEAVQNTLKVLPVSYNCEIPKGESIEIGCIISSSSPVTINSISCTTEAGSDNQPDAPNESALPILPATSNKSDNTAANSQDDWLYTKGNKIVDKNGTTVWLTGVNWFGYNTGTNTFDGLWSANLDDCIASIANHGFNLLRVPISAELINNWSNGIYPTANYNKQKNSQLNNKNSQQIFDYMLNVCKKNGIKVMIDIHSAETNAYGHTVNVWYTNKISTSDYISALSYMAKRYSTNDTIIAYDLKNEPHGKPNESSKAIWNNSTSLNNWKYTAEKAANAILTENPNVLILVEGIEIYPKDINSNSNFSSTNSADYYYNWWGGNLRGVKDYPVNLGKYQNKLIYSPHDYGPMVYKQPWFNNGYDYNSLYKDCWHDNWFYIYENKTAPLLIGEWGGYMTEPNLKWMTCMKKLIIKFKLNHTFWCYNSNSGDTGGLVLDDFTTWDNNKYNFVKDALWQQNGKFVGLDHEIPLGKNGISLNEYTK